MKYLNKDTYILIKEVNYFGKILPAGIRFEREQGTDWYLPRFNGSIHPHIKLSWFYIKTNQEYFIKLFI